MRKVRLYTGVMRGQLQRIQTLYRLADKSQKPLEETVKVFNVPELITARDALIDRANLLLSVYLFEDGHMEPPLPPEEALHVLAAEKLDPGSAAPKAASHR